MSAVAVAAFVVALVVLLWFARVAYSEVDAIIQDQSRFRDWLDEVDAEQRERHARNRERRAAMRRGAPKGENP